MKEGHKYNDSDFEYLDHIGFDFQPEALNCRADRDLDRYRPICIGMDYNANINWIVAGQPDERLGRLNVLKSFYVSMSVKFPLSSPSSANITLTTSENGRVLL